MLKHFFQCALDTCKTTNVYYISDERVKELVEKHGLKNAFQTAPALSGIFNAHQFKVVDHKVEMRSYSTALSLLGQKQNVPTKVTTIPAKEVIIKCGSFVLLSYDFAMYSGSAVKTKRLAAVVKSVHGDGNKINVCYGKALTKKRIQLNENDIGVAERHSIIEVLPCPNFRRGIYEFPKELDIDIV